MPSQMRALFQNSNGGQFGSDRQKYKFFPDSCFFDGSDGSDGSVQLNPLGVTIPIEPIEPIEPKQGIL